MIHHDPEYIFHLRITRTGATYADVTIIAPTLEEAKEKFRKATDLWDVGFDFVSMEEVRS